MIVQITHNGQPKNPPRRTQTEIFEGRGETQESLATWPWRGWHEQAARLYPSPETQRRAILHHLDTTRCHAGTVERLRWFEDLGRDMVEEVAHG